MAWFRAMGADEVAYHEATVFGRDDDHAGLALDYYGSRGETPLRWGGAGAMRLGLSGAVTSAAYEAAFGPGGFRDPSTGTRLVGTRRPGFELVVSAHKSVAVLGVIGDADAMHSILDVETAATVDWLDGWFQPPIHIEQLTSEHAVTRHATAFKAFERYRAAGAASGSQSQVEMEHYELRLRPDVLVEFDLPRNLRADEADLLAQYVKLLVVNPVD